MPLVRRRRAALRAAGLTSCSPVPRADHVPTGTAERLSGAGPGGDVWSGGLFASDGRDGSDDRDDSGGDDGDDGGGDYEVVMTVMIVVMVVVGVTTGPGILRGSPQPFLVVTLTSAQRQRARAARSSLPHPAASRLRASEASGLRTTRLPLLPSVWRTFTKHASGAAFAWATAAPARPEHRGLGKPCTAASRWTGISDPPVSRAGCCSVSGRSRAFRGTLRARRIPLVAASRSAKAAFKTLVAEGEILVPYDREM